MKIPMLDLKKRFENYRDEYLSAIENVVSSGRYILGNNVKDLENDLADYCNVKYGVGVANGTDALRIALDALGVKEGDEVITTPFTFAATADVILHTGANVVFVDVDYDTFNIDPKEIKKYITDKTRCIIVVNLFGHAADWDNIKKEIPSNIKIIEDNAQSIGGEYKGKKTGCFGDISTTSFFPTKNLGGMGDGGMIFTDNEEYADICRKLRVHGATKKYYHEYLGYNSRLDELQAGIIKVNFGHLDEWTQKRREIASYYSDRLKDYVKVPIEKEGVKHVYHQYTIKTDKRDELKKHLEEKGVSTAIYYPVPLSNQPLFESAVKGDIKTAERLSREVLSLPVYPELTDSEIEYIVDSIVSFFK